MSHNTGREHPAFGALRTGRFSLTRNLFVFVRLNSTLNGLPDKTKQWEQMRVPTRPYSGMLEVTRLPDEGMLVQYKIGFVVRFW